MTTSRWTQAAASLLALSLWASVAQAEGQHVKLPINQILSGAIRDVNGVRPDSSTDPATPIYSAALGQPLLAPDGHQLTWGEWERPILVNKSEANIRCNERRSRTHFHLKFRGLIPNALYSVWVFAELDDSSPVLSGRFPANSSQNNGFRTDRHGNAEFEATSEAGPFTISGGEFTGCLFDYQLFSLNMTYHSDGMLHGDVPGPAGIVIQELNFAF
jgi:hypothetical protein